MKWLVFVAVLHVREKPLQNNQFLWNVFSWECQVAALLTLSVLHVCGKKALIMQKLQILINYAYPHHCILSDVLQMHCCLFVIHVSSKNAWQKHILTMSFMRDALVGMVCSPRRLAKRRDLSRAISSNSRCFSVSLSDTGIGMASVASITRDAILIKKGRKHKNELLKNTNLLDVFWIGKEFTFGRMFIGVLSK